ncbi:hypothetical protein ASPFODRAFT_617244 [Aspergillus luchuensis CBS 106.47]|uniref:Uncharacterized protein n=1 Tax=Aspergillus luchuensis (strain CBS 106.47) TaxID=1137211 RepID=A0A1M3TJC5_ASPLC|nr:hypothetical protein ASPFODRAFT_617244 [Aspergillus luchuensis CBS 106.47]
MRLRAPKRTNDRSVPVFLWAAGMRRPAQSIRPVTRSNRRPVSYHFPWVWSRLIYFSHPEFFYPLRDTQGGSWNDDHHHHHLTGSENGTRVAIEKEVPVPVPVPSGVDCRGSSRRQDLKGTSWASPRPGCGPSSSSCQRIIGCQPAVRIRDLVLPALPPHPFSFFPPFLCCCFPFFSQSQSILLFYFLSIFFCFSSFVSRKCLSFFLPLSISSFFLSHLNFSLFPYLHPLYHFPLPARSIYIF